MGRRRDAEAELNLPPGFRFHPTDEELVVDYLCRKVTYQFLPVPIIAEVDLYKYDPWQLPEKALFGRKEWYFFTPRDRKYPNGSRPNRTAGSGYWKATGADKPIRPTGSSKPVGIKKALVFYTGKAPKGVKTDWIMHEYRLADSNRLPNKKGNLRLDNWVLCRLYNKRNSYEKILQQSEDASVGETRDTFEAIEESGSFASIDDQEIHKNFASQPTDGVQMNSFQIGELPKEENEWFAGLNQEDFKNSLGLLDVMPMSDLMTQDYYFSGLRSPQFKSLQSAFLPF